MRWCNVDLNDEGTRRRFRRALMRAAADFARHARDTASILTPYWKSNFTDWLIYETTLSPCGARVESITPDFVQFEANCAGVQTEGICMSATFVIPTSKFTRSQLKGMVHDFEYHVTDYGEPGTLDYGPFDNRENITELEWWYDPSYDDKEE